MDFASSRDCERFLSENNENVKDALDNIMPGLHDKADGILEQEKQSRIKKSQDQGKKLAEYK